MSASGNFRLRYVNQLVGGFVLLILALLVAGAVLIGQRQDWLAETFIVHARLAEKDLDGLQHGTDIVILGQQAGEIHQLEYVRDRPELRLSLKINETFSDQIFEDSIIRIKRKVAGVGEAYLEISRPVTFRAETSPLYGPASPDITVLSDPPIEEQFRAITSTVERVRQSIEDVRDAMLPALITFQETTTHIDDSNTQLQKLVQDWRDLTPKLNELAEQSRGVLENSRRITETVEAETKLLPGTVKQLRATLDGTQEIVSTVQAETRDLPGTVDKLNDSMDGAQDVIDGLKQHWLLRRYIDPPTPSEMIPPGNLGRGVWP